MSADLPLSGFCIGVTASRKVAEQTALLERRGATVVCAPVLALDPSQVDDEVLRAATEQALSAPIDLFLATTGIGLRAWFAAAESWGLADELVDGLAHAEILARGPKSVGALRQRGLREVWSPDSEEFEDVLDRVRGRDLTGTRIVVQEHGQPLSADVDDLRRRGAEVVAVTLYRVVATDETAPTARLVHRIADREVDAVTFTAAPAVEAFMDVAGSTGRLDDLVRAFTDGVIASCVGPMTAAAFEPWGVPTIHPDRSRLLAMIRQLEVELTTRTRRGNGD